MSDLLIQSVFIFFISKGGGHSDIWSEILLEGANIYQYSKFQVYLLVPNAKTRKKYA